ncbi:MAG: flagellar hook-basal body complex protein FliE [Deltaproteobacteria bacterium]|jgi:flagellar hook-basal body complex protein FliE|nr:flagellar hook-basal body complex protein FliE [Deltaproteobacteria bacterium]MBW2489483.1 flagellar hook-basal body complex protein FliE [Deltaproteobacteria bacterium]
MNEVTFQKGLPSLIGPQPDTRDTQATEPAAFGSMLARALNEVNQLNADANEAVENLAAGNQKDIHQTMIALEKADVAFQLLMQVRNKIISAYETIMRMQA